MSLILRPVEKENKSNEKFEGLLVREDTAMAVLNLGKGFSRVVCLTSRPPLPRPKVSR
jgi:hypothetical protein